MGGDWYHVVDADANQVRLDATEPLPPSVAALFSVVLPVADMSAALPMANDAANPDDDTLVVPLVRGTDCVAGSAPQTAYLETGAEVEVVADGARGTFDPVDASNPDSHTVFDVTDINPDTIGLIEPGNFIRTGGMDIEIASGYDSTSHSFELMESVPAMGVGCYFNIVAGYKPGINQTPQVARFPVVDVTRSPAGAGCAPAVTSFEVGCDHNGNLPTDFVAMGAGALSMPVHVLPKNASQFCYQVAVAQRSIVGNLDRTQGWIKAPDTAAPTYKSPKMDPVPFPVDDYVFAMWNPVQVPPYRVFIPPAGKDFNPNWMSNYAVKRSIVGIDHGGAWLETHPHVPFSGENVPFYIWDQNGIGDPAFVATASYDKPSGMLTFLTLTSAAPFLCPDVAVRLSYLDDKHKPQTDVTTLDYDFDPGTGRLLWKKNVKTDGGAVEIHLAPCGDLGPPDGNLSHLRGAWVHGSNTVEAVYPHAWYNANTGGTFDVQLSGFTQSHDAEKRINIDVGDYLEPPDGSNWYTVSAIRHAESAGRDTIVLDRPYTGPTDLDFSSQYATPLNKTFAAQVTIFRNYSVTPLRDAAGNLSSAQAAAFGYDAAGASDPIKVQLAVPLPRTVKPGDYIRAEGDAAVEGYLDDSDHGVRSVIEPGLGDDAESDLCWYQIDSVSADRLEITLTCPVRRLRRAALGEAARSGLARRLSAGVGELARREDV